MKLAKCCDLLNRNVCKLLWKEITDSEPGRDRREQYHAIYIRDLMKTNMGKVFPKARKWKLTSLNFAELSISGKRPSPHRVRDRWLQNYSFDRFSRLIIEIRTSGIDFKARASSWNRYHRLAMPCGIIKLKRKLGKFITFLNSCCLFFSPPSLCWTLSSRNELSMWNAL